MSSNLNAELFTMKKQIQVIQIYTYQFNPMVTIINATNRHCRQRSLTWTLTTLLNTQTEYYSCNKCHNITIYRHNTVFSEDHSHTPSPFFEIYCGPIQRYMQGNSYTVRARPYSEQASCFSNIIITICYLCKPSTESGRQVHAQPSLQTYQLW